MWTWGFDENMSCHFVNLSIQLINNQCILKWTNFNQHSPYALLGQYHWYGNNAPLLDPTSQPNDLQLLRFNYCQCLLINNCNAICNIHEKRSNRFEWNQCMWRMHALLHPCYIIISRNDRMIGIVFPFYRLYSVSLLKSRGHTRTPTILGKYYFWNEWPTWVTYSKYHTIIVISTRFVSVQPKLYLRGW